MTDSPISPTGKETRTRAGSFFVALALLVGWLVVAVYGALNHVDRLARTDAPAAAEQLVWLTRIVAFAFNLGVLVVGAWILWVGHRACRSGLFPPPGLTPTRHIRIRVGRKAKVIGWVAQLVGLLVLVFGTTGTWLFVRTAQTLLRS
jgi:hypothetical protein